MTAGRATLRVATWNIRAAIGPGKPFPDRWWRLIDAERLHAIGELLRGLDADVVALQEVALVSCDADLVDNAGDLARQLGMQVRYGATRSFEVTDELGATCGVGCFGNALLSRGPIDASRAFRLPMAPIDAEIEPATANDRGKGIRYADAPATIREPRTLLLAEIDGVRVASTHFSHIGSGERGLQAARTVEAFAGADRGLLLGDLNAPIEATELGVFEGWEDGFAAAGVPIGAPGRISTDDGWRIDHVLAWEASVRDCRVIREAGELSDHYPVAATVLLR